MLLPRLTLHNRRRRSQTRAHRHFTGVDRDVRSPSVHPIAVRLLGVCLPGTRLGLRLGRCAANRHGTRLIALQLCLEELINADSILADQQSLSPPRESGTITEKKTAGLIYLDFSRLLRVLLCYVSKLGRLPLHRLGE